MGFSGIFATGLSGVNAYASSLEAISNNIANTQTTAYKRIRTDFSTLITSEAPDGGIAAGGVGATNRQFIAEQGGITRTGSNTDLAVSGNGFFIVSDETEASQAAAPFMFTRAGGFTEQTDGTLMNAAGHYLQAAPVDENGAFSTVALTGLETVNLRQFETLAAASTEITLSGNLSANTQIGDNISQNFQIYDAEGQARTVTLLFNRTGDNQWTAEALDGEATLGAGSLVFGSDGRIDESASSFPQSIAISENAGQVIDLNLNGLIQTARATSFTTATADGVAEGAYTGVEISRDGRITAVFSNGLRRDIYQIVLANFINPDGLSDGPSSSFLTSEKAGDMSLDIPLSGRAGGVESAALEVSTADIGQEFSALIETQRAYAANTRVISIADELWRTLTQTAS